jgi:hypothetical protein
MMVVATSACAQSTDAALAHRLVGTWSTVQYNDYGFWERNIEIRADGTMNVDNTTHAQLGKLKYKSTGTWRLQRGHFIYRLIDDGPARRKTPAPTYDERIVSLSRWEWVTVFDDTGLEVRAWKFPDEK